MIKNSSGISVDFFPLPFFYHFWMTFKIKPEERNKFPEVKQPSSPRPLRRAWIISLPAWWNLAKGHLLFLGSPLLFERLQTHTFLLVNLTCATEVGGKKNAGLGWNRHTNNNNKWRLFHFDGESKNFATQTAVHLTRALREKRVWTMMCCHSFGFSQVAVVAPSAWDLWLLHKWNDGLLSRLLLQLKWPTWILQHLGRKNNKILIRTKWTSCAVLT